MIHRDITGCPPELTDDHTQTRREREKARELFAAAQQAAQPAADESNGKAMFEFKAYRQKPVKRKLSDAFAGKCAYCETRYGVVTPGHIDHYRPKGGVDTPDGRIPGYWWLASTWENLLPVCHRCNSPEMHEHATGPERVSGKANAFPLADEAARAKTETDDIESEDPLLLNPYEDDPTEHLQFDEDGVVRARDGSEKGARTIEALGLNRRDLVDARRDHALKVQALLLSVNRALARIEKYRDDPDFRLDLEEAVAELEELAKPEHPYSALVVDQTRKAMPPDVT